MWQTKDKENSTYEGFYLNFWLKKFLTLKSVTDKKQRKFYLCGIWSKLLTKENLNSGKCDRQNTKKILLMRDLILTFDGRKSYLWKVWQTKGKENSTHERFYLNFWLKKFLILKKCDRQKTKKILPMKDLIQIFNWRKT